MGNVKLGKMFNTILVFSSVWAITAHRNKLFYGRFLRILKSIAFSEKFQDF